MYTGTTIFSQVMRHLPWHHFHRIVQHYGGDYKVKSFRCADHYRVMAFAQLTYRESLRDIEACLRAMRSKLFHMGIRSTVSRNNLSNANERRDWRIYAEFAQVLIAEARRLYTDEDLGVDLNATVYALDSTTIDLCLSVFPWARFRRTKGAIKLHTLLNLHGAIPEFVLISDGKLHDVHALDHLIPCPGAYYIMDRGYLDFGRLYRLHSARSLFVTRAKANFKFRRRYSHPVDRTTGLICDQTVLLSTFYPAKAYPEPLRRIKFFDVTTDRYRMYYMGGALRAEGRGDDLLPPRSLPLLCRKRRRHPLEATGSRFGGVPGLRAEQHPSSQGQLPRFGAGSRLDGTLSRSQSHCTGEGPLQGPGLRKGSPWTLRSRIG